MQLYADPAASWRLTTDLVIGPEDGTYLSCFNEEEGAYRGLLVRKSGNLLSIQVGSGAVFSSLVYESAGNRLVIDKQGSTYTVTLNGGSLGEAESPAESYYGTLLVGAERDYDLQVFRQSALTVNNLTVEPM